jgi:hypothetical protein
MSGTRDLNRGQVSFCAEKTKQRSGNDNTDWASLKIGEAVLFDLEAFEGAAVLFSDERGYAVQ